jgi:hypothetical protein
MPYDEEGKWDKNFVMAWIGWALATLGVFALLEWWGLRKEGDEYPPLTYLLRRYVPLWLIATTVGAFASWFIVHMIQTFLG